MLCTRVSDSYKDDISPQWYSWRDQLATLWQPPVARGKNVYSWNRWWWLGEICCKEGAVLKNSLVSALVITDYLCHSLVAWRLPTCLQTLANYSSSGNEVWKRAMRTEMENVCLQSESRASLLQPTHVKRDNLYSEGESSLFRVCVIHFSFITARRVFSETPHQTYKTWAAVFKAQWPRNKDSSTFSH